MPTTETPRSSAQIVQVLSVHDNAFSTNPPQPVEPLADQCVVEAPPFIQAYISSPSGFGVHGLLKSVSRGCLQLLTPISLPLRCAVQVTIAGCRTVRGQVFCCVKKGTVHQVGIVFSCRHKPDIAVGGLAILNALEEPFTVTRGHLLDIGLGSLSILCKTMLAPGAWVRIESNGWILFGEMESVVAISMVACCVGVRLEAALPAASTAPASMARLSGEIANTSLLSLQGEG
jgi:hypothetical protein